MEVLNYLKAMTIIVSLWSLSGTNRHKMYTKNPYTCTINALKCNEYFYSTQCMSKPHSVFQQQETTVAVTIIHALYSNKHAYSLHEKGCHSVKCMMSLK